MGQILYLVHSGGVPTDINDVIMKHVSTMEFGAYEGHPASVEVIDGMASPRKMRSHLEATFFKRVIETKKTKFIVIMRNIKDVLVSYYYMHRSLEVLGKFKGSFEEFVGMYKEGRLQDWFDWNLGWWKYREYPNVMFIKYEELKRDLPGQVRRIMKYLNLDPSDDVISRVCQNASFQQMRKDMSKSEVIEGMFDDQVSPFMRKGQVGDWKRHFTPQLNSYIDQIYSERLAGTGLHFEFEWCCIPLLINCMLCVERVAWIGSDTRV